MTGVTITEFLLARIAEDEAVARAASEGRVWTWSESGEVLLSDHEGEYGRECIIDTEGANPPSADTAGAHIARHDPARVLARCKADRQLLELHGDNGTIPGRYELRCFADDHEYPCDTLKIMALPYADHPDYHPGWRE